MSSFDFQPVILIGAARSGTNMLRDLLTQLPGVSTWPCDEINYIWRYGNTSYPCDELTPVHATARTKRFVRKKFASIANNSQAQVVLEKTCANSLRVGFIREIIPEAKFIFIVRNGLDAALSAQKRWCAPLELEYVMKKAFHIPWSDLPYHAARYLRHRVHRLLSQQNRLPTWGPRFAGIDEISKVRSILETCVWQWKACVESADASLRKVPREDVFYVNYEAFVNDAAEHILELSNFLRVDCSFQRAAHLATVVSSDRIGNFSNSSNLSEHRLLQESVDKVLQTTNRAWGNRNFPPQLIAA
jgi:hypothetical protein